MKKIISGALALMLFAGLAQAQTKDSARHHKGGHEKMMNLNLAEDQKARLKSLHESEKKDMDALRNDKSLNDDQKNARRKELHQKYKDQYDAVYTPAQKEQIEKMKSERKAGNKEGKKAGMKGKNWDKDKSARNKSRGDFEKELNLTQDQQDRMAKLKAESNSSFEALRNDKSLTADQKKTKMQALRKAQQEKMNSILTPEQMEKMKSLRKDEHHGKTRK